MKLFISKSQVWLALLIILGSSSWATAQSSNPCDDPKNLPASYFEVPQGPQGTWTAYVSPEPQQAEDPAVPLVVAGAGALQGAAERRGMRLGCGLLNNRSQKSVAAFQLRWILIRKQERAIIASRGYTPDTVLLTGHTLPIELNIPQKSLRRSDFSIISFAAITAELLKEGSLSGDYVLLVGMHEVRFADGTSWQAAPLLK